MIGLDFETFGEVSLPERGLHNYVTHHSFRPLIASVAERDPAGNVHIERYDFVTGKNMPAHLQREEFLSLMSKAYRNGETIVAHNASFERAVLKHMGCSLKPEQVWDSAVVARAVGAASKLEAAAPQLTGGAKLDSGVALMKKFSWPNEHGYALVDHVEDWTEEDWEDWEEYGHYCDIDALRGLEIAQLYLELMHTQEPAYELVTHKMNERGWPVDLDLVLAMRDQYHANLEKLEERFRSEFDGEEPLNFRSTPQLRDWVAERGLKMKSFDEQSVAKAIVRIEKRAAQLAQSASPNDKRHRDYYEVLEMLRTKQELGGSSLSKLQKILDLVSPDGRLRDQYLHIGAGQSFRTSGRGAQMQNLKRLGAEPGDVEGHLDDWDNTELARNLRQVFKASHDEGELIVGDFSSVESRGLAYLANAEWKLDAFRQGKDMYKVLASSMLGTSYEAVDKSQRQTGKVGELSCGYGAGPKAVRSFAEKMGVEFSEEEAGEIVNGWRETNPEIVAFWRKLDTMLHDVVARRSRRVVEAIGPPDAQLTLEISQTHTPASLLAQRRDAQSIKVDMFKGNQRVLTRWFQGCFLDGKDIAYHKPSELKGGDLWREWWTKDNQRGRYKLYGGKLTGILTQSFCREIFFHSAHLLETRLEPFHNAQIIGQFHDELVVEWWPSDDPYAQPLSHTLAAMELAMTSTIFPGFPLEADIKHAHRYIK